MVRFYDRINPVVITVFVLIQLAAFVYALYAARNGKELPGANWFAAAVAGFPVVTYLTRWFLGNGVNATQWVLLCTLLLAGVSYLANYRAGNALTPLRRVLLLTIVLMSADVLLGSHLQLSGTFGSAPSLGARYNGLGNPATELLLLASVLWVGLHVQNAPSRLDAIWTSAMVLLFVTVVVGAPGLGSDVGGLLVMVLTSIGLVAALSLRRFEWKWIVLAAGGSVLALAAAAVFDYRKAADDRTHLGRLTARVINEGPTPLIDTIARKIDANLLSYGFPWSLGVVAIVLFILIGLLKGKWSKLLAPASSQRVALIAALVGSFVAYAINDSGIVVLCLIAVFVGPYLLVENRANRPKSQVIGSKLEVVIP